VWGTNLQTYASAGGPVGSILINPKVADRLAGGTFGCNYQAGNWVLGIENDISWTGLDAKETNHPPFNPSERQIFAHWFDTLRGRVGYAREHSLWYVTGGIAISDIGASVVLPGGPSPLASITQERTTWVVGAGVEWALNDPHWSIKAEYLYADFGP